MNYAKDAKTLCPLITDFLKTWIVKTKVIGGSLFGWSVYNNNKIDTELEVLFLAIMS